MNITGLHHVTAIAGNPQRNLDFYAGLLGLRFVKRTVNFDDPSSYHFYFGDAIGTPGTILTFFSWPGARRGIHGSGEISAIAFAIPTGSAGYWLERLKEQHVSAERAPRRFGEEVVRFADPDGTPIEFIESMPSTEVQPWTKSQVPPEHSLRGLHSVSAALDGYKGTAKLFTEIFGYRLIQPEGNRIRFAAPGEPGVGRTIDLVQAANRQPARIAAGSVHHIAFRVVDDEQQMALRQKIVGLGCNVSPVMDRTYFHSIYFHEPGGILFEIATDPPGFTKDEAVDELGTHLCLPPWMEPARPQIEESLPNIVLPTLTTV
jgi:glyoxalase family protein